MDAFMKIPEIYKDLFHDIYEHYITKMPTPYESLDFVGCLINMFIYELKETSAREKIYYINLYDSIINEKLKAFA